MLAAASLLVGSWGTAAAQSPSPRPARALSTTAEVARIASRATVTIAVLNSSGDTVGQGSGFLVRANGVLVTNWHVMQGASSAVVRLNSGELYDRVGFVDGDSIADIAILKIPGYDMPVLRPRSSAPVPGEKVITIGSPLGLRNTVSEGIVSATRLLNGRELVQISSPISPGSSGGPVLDAEGAVFAIATSYLEKGQQLNFAVPVRYALGLVREPIAEKPLAEAFGAGTTTAAAAATPEAEERPAPAASPRRVLAGSFAFTETLRRDDGTIVSRDLGVILAGENVRLMVQGPEREEDFEFTEAYAMRSLRTNAAGQVAMEAGGVAYDGYQTEDGFHLTATEVTPSGTRGHFMLTAARFSPKLSSNTGLYGGSLRTQFSINGRSGGATDWEAEMALAQYGDSIMVDLHLVNDKGGSSGLAGTARRQRDGRFVLMSDDRRKTLSGFVRAGQLTATWRDERDAGGVFEGTLVLERR